MNRVGRVFLTRVRGGQASPGEESVKRPARRPGAEEKFFCPGIRFAVISLIIEAIRFGFRYSDFA